VPSAIRGLNGASVDTSSGGVTINPGNGTVNLTTGAIVNLWTTGAPFVLTTGAATYNGQRDDAMYWGYNIGKVVNTEPILQYDMEGHYVDGSGSHWMEENLDYISPDGVTWKRFFSLQVDRVNHIANWAWAGKSFRLEVAPNSNDFTFRTTSSGTLHTELSYVDGDANLVLGGNADATAPAVMYFGPDAYANRAKGISVAKGGFVGINNTTPTAPLDVVGSVQISGSNVFMSSYDNGNYLMLHDGGGTMKLATGGIPRATINSSEAAFNVPVGLKGYTVASLPSGNQGDTAYVTDAVSPTYLGTLRGGGSTVCPVFYNGTAWVAH
jgi:hypothetical protein